ncbi:Fc.00g009010.m01.CDS01 [Cosmosporella sp. VM-42]
MGSILSTIQDAVFSLTSAFTTLNSLNKQYQSLLHRIASSPGLPVPNPTSSFWLDNPPFPHLTHIQGDLPAETDIVIIGSGITAASIAKTILGLAPTSRIVVCEARDICSGATGRNGGHIKSVPYEVFAMFKAKFGGARAKKIVEFQRMHLPRLLEVGETVPQADARMVQTVDVYLEEGDFERAKGEVRDAEAWGVDGCKIWEAVDARNEFGVSETVMGAISYTAGALWPYRLVTGVWNDLLNRHPTLSINTNTPVENIVESTSEYPYTITTPRGQLRARHVVHATNAFIPHLIPSLKGQITGAIAHMSAQRPGPLFQGVVPSSEGDYSGGKRSWSIIYSPGFDYITQLPDGKDGTPGEMMVGGGFFRSKEQGLDQVGVWDDGRMDALVGMHIRGAMETVFEPRWDARVVKAWTGILGLTGDLMPLVGRLPSLSTPSSSSKPSEPGKSEGIKGSGQWIAAGFNGEGMVWAWLSGTALGIMILGKEDEKLDSSAGRPGGELKDWFPDELRVDAKRLKSADLKNLASAFGLL